MKLIPPERPEHFELVADWLGREENYKWLDFGQGVQVLTAVSLKIMTQRRIQFIRIYTADDDDDLPVGVVGLSNIDVRFKTATAWIVLGEKRHGGRASVRAVARFLTQGFEELGLEAVNAWTVETNAPARRLMEKLGFRYIGRQRRCHYLNGRPLDRLWYDLLKGELQDVER
jgi:RimJ/RimL family protein N-acetyltransferase